MKTAILVTVLTITMIIYGRPGGGNEGNGGTHNNVLTTAASNFGSTNGHEST